MFSKAWKRLSKFWKEPEEEAVLNFGASPRNEPALDFSVFGIDFGTSFSRCSIAKGAAFECVVSDLTGSRNTPSIVSFQGRERSVGDKATGQLVRNWDGTVTGTKRILRAPFSSIEKCFLRYAVEECAGGFEIAIQFCGEPVQLVPEQIISTLFRYLHHQVVNEARQASVSSPTRATSSTAEQAGRYCVIGVPAWFCAKRRQGLLMAARMADLNCLQLLNETTAVALEFGVYRSVQLQLQHGSPCIIAFVDMGESSTTVSFAAYSGRSVRMLSHHCDDFLGGRDVDMLLFTHFCSEIEKRHGIDVKHASKAGARLWQSCNGLKKVLSANSSANMECEINGIDVCFANIQRAWFEELIEPLLKRLDALLKQALSVISSTSSSLGATSTAAHGVHRVELVGGSTRIPAVKARLANHFGPALLLSTSLNAEEAVAQGCGVMAAQVSPTTQSQIRPFTVTDCTVYAVCLGFYDEEKATSSLIEIPGAEARVNSLLSVAPPRTPYPASFRVTLNITLSAKNEQQQLQQSYPLHLIYADYEGGIVMASASGGVCSPIEPLIGRAMAASWELMICGNLENTKGGAVSVAVPVIVSINACGLFNITSGEEKLACGLTVSVRRIDSDDFSKELAKHRKTEEMMLACDRAYTQACDARNELESTVLRIHKHLESTESVANKANVAQAATALEHWLQSEDGVDQPAEVYATKQQELLQMMGV